MKRIIRPIPKVSVELAPAGTAVVDQHYDYITEDDNEDETGAVYVCKKVKPTELIPDGFDVKVDKDAKFAKHTFAGWPIPKGAKP